MHPANAIQFREKRMRPTSWLATATCAAAILRFKSCYLPKRLLPKTELFENFTPQNYPSSPGNPGLRHAHPYV